MYRRVLMVSSKLRLLGPILATITYCVTTIRVIITLIQTTRTRKHIHTLHTCTHPYTPSWYCRRENLSIIAWALTNGKERNDFSYLQICLWAQRLHFPTPLITHIRHTDTHTHTYKNRHECIYTQTTYSAPAHTHANIRIMMLGEPVLEIRDNSNKTHLMISLCS